MQRPDGEIDQRPGGGLPTRGRSRRRLAFATGRRGRRHLSGRGLGNKHDRLRGQASIEDNQVIAPFLPKRLSVCRAPKGDGPSGC